MASTSLALKSRAGSHRSRRAVSPRELELELSFILKKLCSSSCLPSDLEDAAYSAPPLASARPHTAGASEIIIERICGIIYIYIYVYRECGCGMRLHRKDGLMPEEQRASMESAGNELRLLAAELEIDL